MLYDAGERTCINCGYSREGERDAVYWETHSRDPQHERPRKAARRKRRLEDEIGALAHLD